MTERTTEELSKSEIARIHKEFAINCKKSFRFYCEHNCKIIDKSNKRIPFKLNQAQMILHDKCMEQINSKGQIRIVIIKGRQQGISTFMRALINWRISYYPHTVALVVAQRDKDLREKHFRALLDMWDSQTQIMKVKHKTTVKIHVDHGRYGDSFVFGETAGVDGGSRGDRYNCVHLTETDYFERFNTFYNGLAQSIPDGQDSIVVVESTSAGRKSLWDLYQKSLDKDSEWEHVFIPWFTQDEYRKELPDDFVITQDEKELQKKFNLDLEQVFWRRHKRHNLGSDIELKREYPNTPEDAFSVSSNLSFFDYDRISDAVESDIKDNINMPLILGIDPSRSRDSTGLVFRRGRNIVEIIKLPPSGDVVYLSKKLYYIIADRRPTHIFCDIGGMGVAPYDYLTHMGVKGLIGVNFGERAQRHEMFANRRAEMYFRCKDWLGKPPCSMPNNEELINQMLTTESMNRPDRLQLVSKTKMSTSPDILDALILTFAEEESYLAFDDFSTNNTMRIEADWNPLAI